MITREKLMEAAGYIGCDVPAVQAVYDVESNGDGFLKDGRIKILFEGHRFWKQLVASGQNPSSFIRMNPKYSNVLHEHWEKKGKYMGGSAEWDIRMTQAGEICDLLGVSKELALRSASYGSFQILGENFKKAGYMSAQGMIAAYNQGGEGEQLLSFIRFIKSSNLDDELIAHNWIAFARGYNGTRYRENQYHLKLAFAFKKNNVKSNPLSLVRS